MARVKTGVVRRRRHKKISNILERFKMTINSANPYQNLTLSNPLQNSSALNLIKDSKALDQKGNENSLEQLSYIFNNITYASEFGFRINEEGFFDKDLNKIANIPESYDINIKSVRSIAKELAKQDENLNYNKIDLPYLLNSYHSSLKSINSEFLQDEISNSIVKLKNIDNGIDNLVLLLAKKLKERLIDEFKYLKNNAQKLNLSRILNIVDITTKDGINDILREIKIENIKKIEELKTNLSLKYDFLKDDFDNGFEGFKDGISKNIDSIFQSEKFALLRLKIEKLSNLKSDLYELETNLDMVIFDTFKEIKMSEILNSLNINGAFFEFLNDKLKHYEKNQKSKLESLEKVLQSLKNQDINILNSFEENLEKIEKLKQLEMGLLNAD